jgi:hypothetical protein
MGRNREYASDAERARAWRDRMREELRRARGEVETKLATRKEVRVKIAKILGMLGSAHPGERDAAFLAAERLLKEAGLTWYELLDVSEKELRKK